jgi:hypothetical protein
LNEYAGTVLGVTIATGISYYCDPLLSLREFPTRELQGGWIFPLGEAAHDPIEFSVRPKTPSLEVSLAFDDLTADTLRGHGTLLARGEWGAYEGVRTDGAAEYLTGLIQLKDIEIGKVRITELESPQHPSTVQLEFAFSAPGATDTVDGRRVLPLSLLDFGCTTAGAPLGLTQREFRQEVAMTGGIALHVEAPLPEGWQLLQSPKNESRKWDFDEGRVKCEVQKNRFVYERWLKLSKEWIPAESWSAYRAFLLDSGSKTRNVAVFGPK